MLFIPGKQHEWNLFNYAEITANQKLLPLHVLFSISSHLNSFRFHYVCSVQIEQNSDLVNGVIHASASMFMLGSGVYSHVTLIKAESKLYYFISCICGV